MKTNRLFLVPLVISDLELFHTINTNPFVQQYLWDNETIPKELSKQILEISLSEYANKTGGLWKINEIDSNTCVGYIGFWKFFEEKQSQLLYALLPNYTGKGYATEAAKKVIEYAFDQLNFNYLVASMDSPNVKSKRVCERLEMQLIEEKDVEDKPTAFYQINKH